MPNPKKNEGKQEYLKRCVEELIEKEGREPDQAYAICNSYWNESKNKAERSAINLTAPLELKKADNETDRRTFYVTAYTGKPVDLGFWGKIIFDLSGLQTKERVPILRDHRRDKIVGFSRRIWVDESGLHLRGDFSKTTRDAQEVLSLADEDFPWQASVGIVPLKIKILEAKEKATINGQEIEGPIEIWTQSQVGEVSLTPWGADNETAAIAMTADNTKKLVEIEINYKKREINMPEITLELLEKEAPDLLKQIRESAEQEAFAGGRNEGIELERKRVIDLLHAEADSAETRKAIESGISAEAAYKQFYEAEKAKRAQGLKEMAQEAPESVGTQEPKIDDDLNNPDLKLHQMAYDLSIKEQIPYEMAANRVLNDNPDLAKTWLPEQK